MTMKRISIAICAALAFLMLSPAALAQKKTNANRPDSYYLAGAVPEVNGKVHFTKQYSIPSMSQAEIMAKASGWVKEYVKEIQGGSSVISEDGGSISAMNHEDMVFSDNSFQRDHGGIHYIMSVKASDGSCSLEVHTITFTYPERGRFTAEEWISDKESLNKNKTKMYPGTAKWRRGTVDFIDDLADDFQRALTSSTDLKQAATAQENAATVAVINAAVTRQEQAPVKNEPEEKAVQPVAAAPSAPVPAPSPAQTDIIPLDQITSEYIDAKGTLTALCQQQEAVAQMGGYLTREDGKVYLTLMFQPAQAVDFLEKAGSFQARYTDAQGKVTMLECDEASLEKGSRGRPHMLIGTLRKATKQ